jgi:hypothetical protein
MKLSIDPSVREDQSASPASTALASWYASHAVVRRMWAIEESQRIRVIVTLEPTLDGDDTHPAWLAHGGAWANELQLCTGRPVHLEAIGEPEFEEFEIDSDGIVVVEMYWRDPWAVANWT